MTLSRDDIADRFRIMPDPQVVDYFSMRGDTDICTRETIDNAERRPISLSERQFAGIGLQVEAETWHFWRTELKGIAPKVGDKFIDSGDATWIVQSADNEMLRNRVRCFCVKSVV